MVLRVLIVDDSPIFRDVAAELLEQRGYIVAGEAGTAAEALDAVDRLRPDAILLDTMLPDGDGADVARSLSISHPEVAVLLVSAMAEADVKSPLSAGCIRGFVTKSELARVELGRYWPAAGD